MNIYEEPVCIASKNLARFNNITEMTGTHLETSWCKTVDVSTIIPWIRERGYFVHSFPYKFEQ